MKSTESNLAPKQNVIRGVCRKLAPTFRRYFGEMARVQVNPTHVEALTQEAEHSLAQTLRVELEAAGLPVVLGDEAAAPAHGWLAEPLAGRRNFMHARLPVSCQFAYLEDGRCLAGAVYFPIEDVLVMAATGYGSSGPERLRVASRSELKDTLLLLPLKTIDTIELKLLEKLDVYPVHTRKTGHPLFDVIDVAAGRADAAIATRLTPLEALVAPLMMVESGGTASDLAGKAPVAGGSLLVANPKLHQQFLQALK
jgi:fructose-1,6-bisphosphatase/inositol monophosphatase family enzyme